MVANETTLQERPNDTSQTTIGHCFAFNYEQSKDDDGKQIFLMPANKSYKMCYIIYETTIPWCNFRYNTKATMITIKTTMAEVAPAAAPITTLFDSDL